MKTKMARGGHRRSCAAEVSRARIQWGEVRGQLGVTAHPPVMQACRLGPGDAPLTGLGGTPCSSHRYQIESSKNVCGRSDATALGVPLLGRGSSGLGVT